MESYDYEAGGTTPVHALHVADESAFTAGDRVKIVSDDPLPWSTTSPVEKMAEIATVIGTGAGLVYLRRLLRIATATNIRVARLSTEILEWDQLWAEDEDPTLTGRSAPLIKITGAIEPRLTKPRIENARGEGIRFVSCFRPTTSDASGNRIKTDSSNAAYGYLIREFGGCVDGRHEGVTGEAIRHLFTTGAPDNTADSSGDLHLYGGSIGAMVKVGWGGESTSAAFDLHPDALEGCCRTSTTPARSRMRLGRCTASRSEAEATSSATAPRESGASR